MSSSLAVITGATGGIGGAISESLCAAGFNVCLVGRNTEKLQVMQTSLSKGFPEVEVHTLNADLTQSDDRRNLIQSVIDLKTPLSLWVNNAGINDFSLFADQDEDNISALIKANVEAPMLVLRQLLERVDHQQPLQIINVGSTFGAIGFPGFVTYSATKFALRGFTEALSRELCDTNIRVRYFAPRATQTALNTDAVNAMNAELKVAMDPPEVVAKAFMAFLSSGGNTAYVGFPEKLFARINSCFPSVVASALKKQLPIIRRYAAK